jgi:hypothetical protein
VFITQMGNKIFVQLRGKITKANEFSNQNELFVTDALGDPMILTISRYDENDFEHSVAESMSELVRFGDETKGVTETPVLSR